MVKVTRTVVTRGAWKRTTIRIDPDLTFSQVAEAGDRKAALVKLQPFILECLKHEPAGGSAQAQVRARYQKLRQSAVKILERLGYPITPGWYYRDPNTGWVRVTAKEIERRWLAGKATSYCAWPHFDDIDALSQADIARNFIIKLDDFLVAYDELSKPARKLKQRAARKHSPDTPAHVRIAHHALELMAPYYTFRAEISKMARDADVGLKTREGGAKGGKARSKNFSKPEDLQTLATEIWRRNPTQSKESVAHIIKAKMESDKSRKHDVRRAGTIAKKISNPQNTGLGHKKPRI